MNERLKKIRFELGKSQEEFGKLLGISKSGVSEIEAGRRKVTEQHIIMLKMNTNVSEQWLRTGEGDMFTEIDEEDELMRWAGRVLSQEDTDFQKKFVKMLMGLKPEHWKLLEEKARELVEENEQKKKS